MQDENAESPASRRCPRCGQILPLPAPGDAGAHVCPLEQTGSADAEAPTGPTRTVGADDTAPARAALPAGDAAQPESLIGADAGTVLGERYELLRRVGRGGMGIVFEARHVVLNTSVAVKVLLTQNNDIEKRRFLLEAQIASKIRHPNIVYIADFGVLPDGRPYLVMEFLRGPTLGEVLGSGRMHVLRALRIALQIAKGMQAVHDQGIVHRDLKPSEGATEREHHKHRSELTAKCVQPVEDGRGRMFGYEEAPHDRLAHVSG